jgi:hypothetical protein
MTSIPRTVPIGFIVRIAPLVLRNTSPISCQNRHLRPKPAVPRCALTPLLPVRVVGRCCTLLPLASTRCPGAHPLQPLRKLRCSRPMLLVRVIVRCSLRCRPNIRVVVVLIRVDSNPPLRFLTFHPRCCLPGSAASGSGVGKKPLRSLRSGDQGERGPRLPARYGSVPINDVRSNAAGSLSSLIFDKHSFQVYLQFNNTTTAYLQCCRLPMLQAPNNAAGSLCCSLPTMQQAPYAAAGSLYAARLQQCSKLPLLHASNMWRYRTQCCCLCCSRLPLCCTDVASSLCCRLPTVAIPHCKLFRTRLPTAMLQPNKWLPTAMLLPILQCMQASNNAAASSSMLRLPSTACRKTACRELPAE